MASQTCACVVCVVALVAHQELPLSRQNLSPCTSEALEQNIEVNSCLLHGGGSMGWGQPGLGGRPSSQSYKLYCCSGASTLASESLLRFSLT